MINPKVSPVARAIAVRKLISMVSPSDIKPSQIMAIMALIKGCPFANIHQSSLLITEWPRYVGNNMVLIIVVSAFYGNGRVLYRQERACPPRWGQTPIAIGVWVIKKAWRCEPARLFE